MAHKKGQGSSKNGRDSNPQYRGIKLYGGENAKPGAIIVRQCGTKFSAGFNVRKGKDDTLFAVTNGKVVYQSNGRVHVDPFDDDIARPQWLREYRAAKAS
jgi:large subunit ribosomal protein L27